MSSPGWVADEVFVDYNVTFCGDFFPAIVHLQSVDTEDDEKLIALANNVMVRHYGIDLAAISSDIEVEDQTLGRG